MTEICKDEVREITTGKQPVFTQAQQVLWYMKHRGMITSMDAIREFGCTRLAARIADLRKDGYAIIATPVTVVTANGRTTKVAGYSLVEVV